MRIDVAQASIVLPVGTAFNAQHSWQDRRSALLRLQDDAGHVGYGEATPLPGFSPDDFESALAQLRGLTPDAVVRTVEAFEAGSFAASELCPSAHFALECAALDVAAQRRGESVQRFLERNLAATVAQPVQPPRDCDLHDLLGGAELPQVASGTVKCKVGRDLVRELDALRRLRQRRPSLRIRLDANGSLPPADVERWLSAWAQIGPEFVEEPCSLEQLGAPRVLPVAIAFDESLLSAAAPGPSSRLAAWLQSGAVRALVLKPMLLGGVAATVRWIHVARQHRQEVIVSHLFDGSVAAAMYRQLARFGSSAFAMGLGPHAGLRLWRDVPLLAAADGSTLSRSTNR